MYILINCRIYEHILIIIHLINYISIRNSYIVIINLEIKKKLKKINNHEIIIILRYYTYSSTKM